MEERETQARRLAFAGAAALVMLAASAAPAGGGVVAADETVTVGNNFFDDSTVTISPGDTVTWTKAGTGVSHDVDFADGVRLPASAFGSPWTVDRTFTAAGVYAYQCSFHPTQMTGTVTVSGTAPSPPPPPPPGGTPPPGGYPPPGGSPGTGTPGSGGGGTGSGKASTAITLRVSDSTPTRGSRVRFFGSVRPDQDGRRVQLQRRKRGGSYRTIARIALRDAGSSRSKFSKRLRIMADAVFRARIPADAAHEAARSRTRRVNVP